MPRSRRLLAAFGDVRLVEQVRRGNQAAFSVLFDRHHRGVLSFCRHMLGSADEAEDAVQQTFISAYESLLRTDRPVALKPWLYTIARNRCLSMLRARREHAGKELEPATEGLAAQVERRQELRELLGDIAGLQEDQRGALLLSELGDLSHADIAGVLGCETAKVKSLVFQARTALAESRRARETPCEEIREQLSSLRGGALRRGTLRKHVRECPGCAEFREEVRRQRAMMAAVLPVVPSLGFKESALAAVGLGGGGGGAAAAGGIGGMLAGSGAAKVAAVAAVAGGTAGGVAVTDGDILAQHDSKARSAPALTAPAPPREGPAAPTLPAQAAEPARAAAERREERRAERVAERVERRGRGRGKAVAERHAKTPPGHEPREERGRKLGAGRGSEQRATPAKPGKGSSGGAEGTAPAKSRGIARRGGAERVKPVAKAPARSKQDSRPPKPAKEPVPVPAPGP